MIVIVCPSPVRLTRNDTKNPGDWGEVQRGPTRYYYADTSPDGDGWCGPLREHRLSAVLDGHAHQQAMAATKDERR